jgi:hypothetical protein
MSCIPLYSDITETQIGIEFANLQSHLADTIGNYLFALDRWRNRG